VTPVPRFPGRAAGGAPTLCAMSSAPEPRRSAAQVAAGDVRPSASGMPVVGMVGGGQLSRMTAQAAITLGTSVRVLTRGVADSAAQVVHGPVVGDELSYDDLRAFARACDVVTFDHEHVPPDVLARLADDGVVLRPDPAALLHAQDKLVMRHRLRGMGLPVPRFAEVADRGDVEAFAAASGWPVVLKSRRGGYDGKGVWVAGGPDEVPAALEAAGPAYVEEHVALTRELAAVVARSPSGQGVSYPVVETVQADGVCVEVVAPAPGLDDDRAVQAETLALGIAAELGVVGVLAVELFDTEHGLVVNELAMRPHNSAHWTIEGARTSQFEQHLRAVLDLPLGAPTLTAPAVVMVNVLGPDDPAAPSLGSGLPHVLAKDPAVRVHLYGKALRPGRKVGHVTALASAGEELASVRERARDAAAYLRSERS
jgi:5-(carboxyamino)imidazole ribonucleotide synthase